jgi:hypothetical protein
LPLQVGAEMHPRPPDEMVGGESRLHVARRERGLLDLSWPRRRGQPVLVRALACASGNAVEPDAVEGPERRSSVRERQPMHVVERGRRTDHVAVAARVSDIACEVTLPPD